MRKSTLSVLPTASPASSDLSSRLAEGVNKLLELVSKFGTQPPTPAAMFAFEKKWRASFATRVER